MRPLAAFVALFLVLPRAAAAQQPTSGAFLFSYRPDDRPRFEEGYVSHLDWHREKADSLAWWGWDVLAGPGLGHFVDGVFGVPFAAIDARVDPAGDAANGAATFQPHATATGRELLVLREDLGTATPLEDRAPTRFVQVVRYRVGPRDVEGLEAALAAMRDDAPARGLLPYTVYETLAGAGPGFVLMVWRDDFASFDDIAANPERLLRTYMRDDRREAGSSPDARRMDVVNELWLFRRDLTYLPGEEGQ